MMASMTSRFRGQSARVGVAAALSLVAILVSVAPASAQARVDNGRWDKNRKAEQKAARKAARLGAGPQQRVIVGDNGGVVIDRSRNRRSATAKRWNPGSGYTYRNGYYYDRSGACYDTYGNRVNNNYGTYPQYRNNQSYSGYGYNPYNNYGNGNGYGYGSSNYPYYSNREGDKDRDDVARAAAQNGYNAGFQRGQYDAARRNAANPYGHGAYQFGYDGFDPSWGSASTYQQNYRQYFIQGYNDAYGQRGGYNRNAPRRRY